MELIDGRLRAFLNSRAVRQGSVAAVITLMFVAVVVLLNLFIAVVDTMQQWRLDLTAEQAFVLTDESRQFLAGMDVDVTIYVLTPEVTLTAAGDYFIQANEVMRQYAALSPHITLRYIDLTREPAFAARFPQFQLNAQTILLVSDDRVEVLNIFDLFNIESDAFGHWIASSRAEQMLTGALLFLAMDRQVTVSVLGGFGESDSSGLVALLEANRYRVIHQNLLTEEIDPEASVVIINAPSRDYPQEALARLDRFLQGERDNVVMYFASVAQPPLPNLEAFLADWGIIVGEGIVYQTDTNMTWGGPFLSAVHYTESVFARHAIDFFSIMPNPRPLDFVFHERGTRVVSAPMVFGETVAILPPDAEEGWAFEEWGPFAALALSRDEVELADGSLRTSTLAVFASDDFVDINMLRNPHLGNAQYMLGLFEGLSEHVGGVAIAPKTIGMAPLPVSDFQVMVYGVLFTVALPLAVVLAGGMVYLRRRHM